MLRRTPSRSCSADPSAKATDATRLRKPASRPWLAALACLLALGGCRRDSRSTGALSNPEEHAAHIIPAHKPKDFPSAVRRLRELNGQIASKLADGNAGSLAAGKTLPIAFDIANWLPEIAADSDMPEPPWNEVNDRSETLVTDYQKIMSAISDQSADASTLTVKASATIKALETLLDSADPRWFDSTRPGAHR